MDDSVEGGGAAERDWSDMTAACLVLIFQRLGLEGRWRAVAVCRAWRAVALTEPSLFAALDLEQCFDAYCFGRPDTAHWWTPAFQRRVDGMLRSASAWADGELREVRIRHCSDDALCSAAERSPKLRILSVISSQSLTDRSMIKVAACCAMLSELDISNCYEVSYRALETIGQNCPNLVVLKRNFLNWLDPSQHARVVPEDYLRACPQDIEQEIDAISSYMPRLTHLELKFSKLSNRGLVLLAKGCTDLEVLDLSGCANLTGRGITEAVADLKSLHKLVKPNFFIPRAGFVAARYGHWQLYDDRFQTNVFRF